MCVCTTSLHSLCLCVRVCLCMCVHVCAAIYEEHGCTLKPWTARACRSMAWAGCCPGRAFISVRFLTQPVIPDTNFPPVIVAMSGAPPVTRNQLFWTFDPQNVEEIMFSDTYMRQITSLIWENYRKSNK